MTVKIIKDDPPPPPDIEWTCMTRALAQVLVGNLMILGGVGSIIYECYLGLVSTGIWVGLITVSTGIVGVADAARSPSRGSNSSLRKAYTIMLICCLLLSMTLLALEVGAYLLDREPCDLFESMEDYFEIGATERPTYPPGCVIECVRIHEGLIACSLLEFAAAAASIYYCAGVLMKQRRYRNTEPIPYKPMLS